jgi:two-component system, OmpR family, heavy metal sensor histidine kinase CusS
VLQANLEDLDRLQEIVNDMLFLARADQGVVTETLSSESVAAIVHKTADFLDVVLEEASVKLEIDGDAVAPVEPQLLGRALTNLIDNAVRHGERPGLIRVVIDDLPEVVRISVHNRGAHIAPQHLSRLFDRFYRLDPARKGSSETHGLGLAIVKAVAVMHRGEVFARCESGEIVVGFEVPRFARPERIG